MREMGQSAWLSTSYPTIQGTEGRVNARETGAGCNDWISWGNNYSVWPCPAADGNRSQENRAFTHKTMPTVCTA